MSYEARVLDAQQLIAAVASFPNVWPGHQRHENASSAADMLALFINANQVQPGTHITAMGSDDHGKQELSSALLGKADVIVADSKSQCIDHGECHAAARDRYINQSDIVESGEVIKDPTIGRIHADQITIADLTGVAVQDIQIALRNREKLLQRNCSIVDENLRKWDAFFDRHDHFFDWRRPDGSCMAFPRYKGSDGVEQFCQSLVDESGILFLPSTIYRSELGETPADRFRLGFGRRGLDGGLAAFDSHMSRLSG